MTVVVNGRNEELPDGVKLSELVQRLGRDPTAPGTAVARNGDVVPRRQWPAVTLSDGDAVEVVTAVGGG